MNIRDIKRKKITEMTTDEILAERKFYEDVIANCKYEKPQDIADLFEAYTMLIWKHKQVGRVYDFYFDGLKEERDGGDNLEGSDHVVLDTLRALARTPDLNVVFEEIHCIGNPKDGFRFGQVVWNDATTVDGVGPDGPGSGLGYEDREDLEMCECWIRKIDGKYRPTKRNGDACKTLCFKLVSELSVYTQKNLLTFRAVKCRGDA